MTMTVTADTAQARDALRTLGAGLVQASQFALRSAVDAAKSSAIGTSLWRDRTGDTRRSITSGVTSGSGFVQAGGASRFLEFGTRAHEIEGRRGGMLRFQMNGATMFRRRVWHPGTAPRPFMADASERGQIAADYGAEYFAEYAIGRMVA